MKIKGLHFRKATQGDSQRLFKWRNDPETRAQSLNTDSVPWADHKTWFEKTLSNPDRLLLIAEEEGIPVGTVRIDTKNGEHELSWTIAPDARGKGVGTRMVTQIVQETRKKLFAKIKPDNVASIKIAEKAGFMPALEKGDTVITKWVFNPPIQ